ITNPNFSITDASFASITTRRSSDASRTFENLPVPFYNTVNHYPYAYFLYTPSLILPSVASRLLRQPWGSAAPPASAPSRIPAESVSLVDELGQSVLSGCDCEACGGVGSDCPCLGLGVLDDVGSECGPGCGCGPECGNRLIQNGVAVRVKIVRDARKGWCLHSDQWIRKKEFLFEYAVLVSRQFVDMTRMRIEGLLAAFPKLIGTGKQHTYVETENVRYVYQPMEALYLLLITNKQSNILEDLDTLRILSKLVPEYSYYFEESICKCAFDLILISLGHKENVTVAQVKQYCEMESHEEKLHRQMREDKIREAKDEMKRKANEIDKNKIIKNKGDNYKGGFGPLQSMGSEIFENSFNDTSISSSGTGSRLSFDVDSFSTKSKGLEIGGDMNLAAGIQ
ncbi:hypothetical protein HN51_040538, partial [Arachis hypogaea]